MDNSDNYRCIPLLRDKGEIGDSITWEKIFPHIIDFQCEERDFKNYLVSDAIHDWKSGITKTFLLFWKNRLVGYFSLTIDNIIIECNNVEERFPSLRITHIARDSRYKGWKIGDQLMSFVFACAYLISNNRMREISTGGQRIEYILVEAKKGALPYYAKRSFQVMKSPDNPSENIMMYVDIRQLFEIGSDDDLAQENYSLFELNSDKKIFTGRVNHHRKCRLEKDQIYLDSSQQ